MTQDEIIRMAREAGFSVGLNDPVIYAAHERFAALVAAHEREVYAGRVEVLIQKQFDECEAAVLAEREACENAAYVWSAAAAKAIRARGEK